MPDKIIRLAILADVNKARAQLDDISARLKVMSDKPTEIKVRMAQIPSTDLRAVEAEGQKAGNKFTSGLKSVIDKAGPMAAGALVAGLAFAIKEGIGLQQTQAQLASAIHETGGRYTEFAGKVDAAQDRMAKFGFTGTQVDSSLAQLTRSSGSAAQAIGLEATAANVAAARHISLSQATQLLASSVGSGGRILKQLGITMVTGASQAKAMEKGQETLADQITMAGGMAQFAAQHHMSLAKAQNLASAAASGSIPAYNKLGIEVLPATASAAYKLSETQRILNSRLGGAAAAQASTFTGKLDAMKASFTNVAESVGMKVLPALTGLLGIVAKIINDKPVLTGVAIGVGAIAAAWIAVQIQAALAFVAENLALVGIPILIALIVAGLYEMHKHWKEIAAWLNSVWAATMSWVKSVWHDISKAAETAIHDIRGFMADLWMHITQVYQWILQGAVDAFGWVPGLGSKLRTAAAKFEDFRRSVDKSLAGINNRKINVEVGFSAGNVGSTGNPIGEAPKKAAGGAIYGPGTTTSDSIHALLSNREYVVQASAHDHYGTHLLDMINTKRFAGGGAAGLTIGTSFPSETSITNILLQRLIQVVQSGASMMMGSSGFYDSGATSHSAAVAQAYARSVLGRFGWGQSQFPPLQSLWNQESGWNAYAVNASSGAYGIPQSLGHGHPYNLGDYIAQILWGLSYIKQRYGSPGNAEGHELAYHWYDNGGLLKPGLTLAYNGTGHNEIVSPNATYGGGGGVNIAVSVNVPVGADTDATARAVHQMLRRLKIHKGNQPLGLD